MNPLIKDTVDKIANNFKLTEGQKIIIAYYIGEALMSALLFAKDNPNYNLKGCDSVDENTITTNRNLYENMFKKEEDRSDWDVESPESIECCNKCKMPNKQMVKSKRVGYYICLCNFKKK
jgi:hypothetical protein